MPITIIPAIDIINGKCVRLEKGNYSSEKIYRTDPLEVAKEFEDAGVRRLHLVDLDGARDGKVRNWKSLEKIAGGTRLVIDFGGGVKEESDVRIILNSGARLVTVGSVAVKEKNKFLDWVKRFGKEIFIVSADVREKNLAVAGWQESTNVTIDEFISNYLKAGISHFACTDIGKDGMLQGTSLKLYTELMETFPGLKLIASGGFTRLEELEQLEKAGCSGVIIGKAIYEKKISLTELKPWLNG